MTDWLMTEINGLWLLLLLLAINVAGFFVLRSSSWRWLSAGASVALMVLLGLVLVDDPPAGCHFARNNALPAIGNLAGVCPDHALHGSAMGMRR